MKKLFMVIIILMFSNAVFAGEVYKKIAENNVEVFNEVTVKDMTGADKIILEYSFSLGQDWIDSQTTKAQTELSDAENLDALAYKQGLIVDLETWINKLTTVLSLFDTETLTDKDGNEFIVYNKEQVKKYAEVGISFESLEKSKLELIEAQNLDEVAYKQDLIAKAQARLDKILLIQTEMNKEILK